jgi:toxin ParE1/3/4
LKRVVLTLRANLDLAQIIAFVSEDAPDAAVRLEQRLRQKATQLSEFPAMGTARPGSAVRVVQVPGTPYALIYREERDRIVILRIWHGARAWPPAS